MQLIRLTPLPLLAVLGLAALPAGATAASGDRDRDGMSDRWERKYKVRSAKADHDRDRLSNRQEFRLRTDPRDADTDNDSLRDGREARYGLDPTDRDSDNDGVHDDDERAGVIASFVDGVLTITLASGGQVAAQVDAGTEIECEDERSAPVAGAASRDDDDDDRDEDNDRDDDDDDKRSSAAASNPSAAADHDDDDDDHGDDDDDEQCGTEALRVGRVVEEAEIAIGKSGVRFEEIELK